MTDHARRYDTPVKNLLLPVLPNALKPYAKAIIATIGALAYIAVYFFGPDQPALAIVVPVLTTLGVYVQPNGTRPTRDEVFGSVSDAVDEYREAHDRG
ncbi:hypothetical protein NX794_07570 [Streptomyces sp. LP11]|uniref:Holin n=1 Tax=Streptomyces pyxinicus TaxID=2970331 RepID=A0ABT2AXW5_9ACTN|nr:hypothetical protein [Streptomyces sp. LP11]MCS0601089.1 hypothetical protein [Streptomyces sp. LP11]